MRVVRVLVVVLVVVAALGLVLDRTAVWLANRAVAEQVARKLSEYGLDSAPPEVSVAGFPFLTQVADGRYDTVEVTLRDVGREGLRLPLVELTATGVTAPLATVRDGSGTIDADHVTGRAVIGYGSVVRLAERRELELAGGDDGGLRMRLPVEVLGVDVTLAGRAEVVVDGDALLLRPVEFEVAEPDIVPPGAEPLIDQAARRLWLRVPLPQLPYDLRVDSVQVESAGIVVFVSATDVRLAG